MAIEIVLLYACGFIAGVGGYGDLMIGTIGQVRNGITAPNGIEYLASRISEGTGCIISISNNGDGTLRAPHWDVFEGEVEGSVPQEIGPRQSVALKFHKSKIGNPKNIFESSSGIIGYTVKGTAHTLVFGWEVPLFDANHFRFQVFHKYVHASREVYDEIESRYNVTETRVFKQKDFGGLTVQGAMTNRKQAELYIFLDYDQREFELAEKLEK